MKIRTAISLLILSILVAIPTIAHPTSDDQNGLDDNILNLEDGTAQNLHSRWYGQLIGGNTKGWHYQFDFGRGEPPWGYPAYYYDYFSWFTPFYPWKW